VHSYLDDEFLKLFGLPILLLFHGVPDSEQREEADDQKEASGR
jgi:hypothetical protein